jgi:hypothetical protein
LNAKNEKTNSSSINNSLGQFVVMFSDAAESKSSSLFDRGVKLFKAINESIKSTRVNNGFCEGG